MKILLIGSGGREHAIARKIAESPKCETIYCVPGNGGTAFEPKCKNIDIKINESSKIVDFCKQNLVDLVVVGPEEPLINGIVDICNAKGIKAFGPSKNAAMLEGSKTFSKEFMKKYGVKTAKYESFTDYSDALSYLEKSEFPIVIKADGLAAGKGVYICEDFNSAKIALEECMVNDVFKGAGKKVVIEEFLQGVEASILSITDGKTIIPFVSAKDHKQIFDGGKGPNTGGMGVVSPNPYVTQEVFNDFCKNIMGKTLEGIKEENFEYKGIIFFGVMITAKGCYLLEYNVRMGDPETQSVLSLMESDFLELIEASLDEKLNKTEVKWRNMYSCNVVLASSGYPGSFKKGLEIDIKEEAKSNVLIAGGVLENGILVTSGGRVLSVIGLGKTLEEARRVAYNNISNVNFEGKYFRNDIGL
ncbi:phosphoribosylamine--glycine ligase [Clostridium cavendishii DSM 21758]|uniref:Phosphoribosylamine--glycine ligase n=1 Tax=Clostridium cavendishii DSM 21758 TaxID=1121302 RepID=A0A1M6NU17_9CLOT|nr:phosphoribosylamine--glycine ligase [Clostridium cavendishii]SHJ99191.1 phosphoribosylamine--glycine ligase [Clostridium cavendishii DSM 21758]